MEDKKKKVGVSLGLGSALGVLYGLDPTRFISFLSEAFGHQLVQFSIVFALAAYIHRRGMKKDNANLTEAINKLGHALRTDLGTLGNEIVLVKDNVSKINSRVTALEKLKE